MTSFKTLPALAAAAVTSACASSGGAQVAPVSAPVVQAEALAVEHYFMEGIGHFNRHDIEPFLNQFHEDIRMYAVSEWLEGKEALRTRFQTTFDEFPKARMEITNLKAHAVAPGVVTVTFEFHAYPLGAGGAFHGVGSGAYVKTPQGWREVLEHETVTKRDKIG